MRGSLAQQRDRRVRERRGRVRKAYGLISLPVHAVNDTGRRVEVVADRADELSHVVRGVGAHGNDLSDTRLRIGEGPIELVRTPNHFTGRLRYVRTRLQ